MQLRMRNLPALLPVERTLAYYCAGLNKQAFCASIRRGDAAAVNLALDVVAAELWLGEHDAAKGKKAYLSRRSFSGDGSMPTCHGVSKRSRKPVLLSAKAF